MPEMHSTSLLNTPWPFWTGISSQVSKNDDKKRFLRIIWLYVHDYAIQEQVHTNIMVDTALAELLTILEENQ